MPTFRASQLFTTTGTKVREGNPCAFHRWSVVPLQKEKVQYMAEEWSHSSAGAKVGARVWPVIDKLSRHR